MISKNHKNIELIHKIELDKPKGNWNTYAEQKRIIAPKEVYKAVLRSGTNYIPSNAQYGEGGLLYEELSDSANRLRREELTAQINKEVVSMGDIKVKSNTPTVSQRETVSKEEESKWKAFR